MDPIGFDMLSSDSSYASDVSDDSSATENLKYKCKYCPKMYSKRQALGGHQNAHKKEINERQKQAIPARMNQPDPYPFPSHDALPPGFEQPLYNVEGPNNQDVVCKCNQRTFARQFDPNQRMGRDWAHTENPYQPIMAQPQPQPLLSTPSSVCLDLCLAVGSSSQAQTQTNEPTNEIEVAFEKEDDDLSLSLSLKL